MQLSQLRRLRAFIVTLPMCLDGFEAPIAFAFSRHFRVHQGVNFSPQGRVVHMAQLQREVVHVPQSVREGGQGRGDRATLAETGRMRLALGCGRRRWKSGLLLLNDARSSTGGIRGAKNRLHERQGG